MSKILSPILLDETGQQINQTLQQIEQALRKTSATIDDTLTAETSTWSSQKITNALTTLTSSGTPTSALTFEPIAATPLHIKTTVETAGTIQLTLSNGEITQTFLAAIEQPGIYNWDDATIQVESSEVIQTSNVLYGIYGLENTNTLQTSGGASTIQYSTLAAASSSYDFIFGGGAADY